MTSLKILQKRSAPAVCTSVDLILEDRADVGRVLMECVASEQVHGERIRIVIGFKGVFHPYFSPQGGPSAVDELEHCVNR